MQTAFSDEECAAALELREEDGVVISQHTLVEQEKRISNFDKENPDVDVTEEMREEAAVIAHQRKLQSRIESFKDAAFEGKLGEQDNSRNSDEESRDESDSRFREQAR